jgi:cystathionine beta-lyase
LRDTEQVRAPVIAGWLSQLCHEGWVLDEGADAATLDWRRTANNFDLPDLRPISVDEAAAGLLSSAVQMIDLRPGLTYRRGHAVGRPTAPRMRIA